MICLLFETSAMRPTMLGLPSKDDILPLHPCFLIYNIALMITSLLIGTPLVAGDKDQTRASLDNRGKT